METVHEEEPPPVVRAPRLERSNSIANSSKPILALVPTLSPSQVLLIRKSWRHINTKRLNNVIKTCFQRLESSNQSVALAFRNASSSNAIIKTSLDHSKYFLTFLDRIIDGEPDLDLELKQIGAKHAFLEEICGVNVHDVERLGELIAEAFLKLDGISQSKETRKAWRLLIAQIIDHVRDGFETESRFQRRRTSFMPGANNRRNSMPNSANRKTSLKVDVSQITRKLSNF